MENNSSIHFDNAIVIAGLKLLHDFNSLTPLSLHVMLANMQFVLKRELNNTISIYSSEVFNNNVSTLVLVNPKNAISKVRYLNVNIDTLLG